MQKVFGPFSGYFVVVYVAQASQREGSFSASYKMCRDPNDVDCKGKAVIERQVAGFSSSIDEGFAIALQLARLHAAGLHSRVAGIAKLERQTTSALANFAGAWGEDREFAPLTYQPTMPCPLQPMASRES